MAEKTALDLLAELRLSDGINKIELSHELEEIFSNEPPKVEGMFVSLLNRVLISNVEPRFTEIAKSEFYKLRISVYEDIDGRFRVAMGVSYLQDFEDFDVDLDMRVMLLMINEISKVHLDLVLNDVCINDIQFRNGELVDYA